jgi:hypothetical protein
MKYTIYPGSIASIQTIKTEDGKLYSAIYMSDTKQPEIYPDGNLSVNIADKFPIPVRAAINRYFGGIFSLPYDRREGFIINSVPFTITAEDMQP